MRGRGVELLPLGTMRLLKIFLMFLHPLLSCGQHVRLGRGVGRLDDQHGLERTHVALDPGPHTGLSFEQHDAIVGQSIYDCADLEVTASYEQSIICSRSEITDDKVDPEILERTIHRCHGCYLQNL